MMLLTSKPGPPRSVGGSGPCAPSRFGVDTVDDSLDSFEDTPRFLALRNQKSGTEKLAFCTLGFQTPKVRFSIWTPQSLTSGSMMFHLGFRGV